VVTHLVGAQAQRADHRVWHFATSGRSRSCRQTWQCGSSPEGLPCSSYIGRSCRRRYGVGSSGPWSRRPGSAAAPGPARSPPAARTAGRPGRRAPKNTAMDTPAETIIEPKPTGLTGYSMPRRNSGWIGESFDLDLADHDQHHGQGQRQPGRHDVGVDLQELVDGLVGHVRGLHRVGDQVDGQEQPDDLLERAEDHPARTGRDHGGPPAPRVLRGAGRHEAQVVDLLGDLRDQPGRRRTGPPTPGD
jgi:hypothetical protein